MSNKNFTNIALVAAAGIAGVAAAKWLYRHEYDLRGRSLQHQLKSAWADQDFEQVEETLGKLTKNEYNRLKRNLQQ